MCENVVSCIAVCYSCDAAMLYPLLWIDYQKQVSYDGIFRLRKIKDCLLSTFGRGLLGNCFLFDLGSCSAEKEKLQDDTTSIRTFEACFSANSVTGMHKQLALSLHQAVWPVCNITTPVAVPTFIHTYCHLQNVSDSSITQLKSFAYSNSSLTIWSAVMSAWNDL